MSLQHLYLFSALTLYCIHSWAGELPAYLLEPAKQTEIDYTKIGTLTNVLPVPSKALHGAVIKTIGDLSIRLPGGQVIDFQDETAETLEIADVQINKVPEMIATGVFPSEISKESRENLLGLKQAIETNIGASTPFRITSKNGEKEAFIFQGSGENTKTWVTFVVSNKLKNSYTMIISKGFEKSDFDQFLLQGTYGK